MSNELIYDVRLQQKSVRDGKLTHQEIADYLTGLPDTADKVVTFDDEGAATNLPTRTLKELAIKPAEPEPVCETPLVPIDPLADAWDDMPRR